MDDDDDDNNDVVVKVSVINFKTVDQSYLISTANVMSRSR